MIELNHNLECWGPHDYKEVQDMAHGEHQDHCREPMETNHEEDAWSKELVPIHDVHTPGNVSAEPENNVPGPAMAQCIASITTGICCDFAEVVVLPSTQPREQPPPQGEP
jgi:hypothetical protein